MAAANKHNHRETFARIVYYTFRGKDTELKNGTTLRANHDHTLEEVSLIDTNMKIQDPLIKDENGNLIGVDREKIENIINDFEELSKKYKGKGNLFCAHYSISLAPNETLDDLEWAHSAKIFLHEHGYTNNKFVVVRHKPSSLSDFKKKALSSAIEQQYPSSSNKDNEEDKKEHIHIIVHRLIEEPKLRFVSDSNDYSKNESACRKIENLYKLQKVLSSNETWNSRPNKDQEKGIEKRQKQNIAEGKNINDGLKESDIPTMKALLKEILENKKPKSMTEFVGLLDQVNMQTHVKTKKDSNEISGIAFSYNGGQQIGGAKLHRHKLSWPRLLDGGITYEAARDNKSLGLGEHVISTHKPIPPKPLNLTYTPAPMCPELDNFTQKTTQNYYAMLRIKPDRARSQYVISRHSIYKRRSYFVAIPFSVNSAYINIKYFDVVKHSQEVAKFIMDLIKSILSLFGIYIDVVPERELSDYRPVNKKEINNNKALSVDKIPEIKEFFSEEVNFIYKSIHQESRNTNEKEIKIQTQKTSSLSEVKSITKKPQKINNVIEITEFERAIIVRYLDDENINNFSSEEKRTIRKFVLKTKSNVDDPVWQGDGMAPG